MKRCDRRGTYGGNYNISKGEGEKEGRHLYINSEYHLRKITAYKLKSNIMLSTSAILFLLVVTTTTIVFASEEVTSVTGDVYLDDAYKSCQTKDAFGCAKYRALNYIHKLALGHVSTGRGFTQLPLLENLRLIRLQSSAAVPSQEEATYELFDAVPRSSDSELMRFYRFGLREVERFARTYAVSVPVPESQNGFEPRIISEEQLEQQQQGRALEDGKSRTYNILN
jgi:hypothetical protein